MPNIDTYLQQILAAIYGEEVRGSIHNAIQEINEVVENWESGLMDTTLTSTTLPAQGKVVGDFINDLRSLIQGLENEIYVDLFRGMSISENTYIRGDSIGSASQVNGWSAIVSYVPVEPNTAYTLYARNRVQGALYDAQKTFVSGVINDSSGDKSISITTGSTVKYIRMSSRTEDIGVMSLYKGTASSPSLNESLEIPQIEPIVADLKKLNAINDLVSLNILAPATLINGRYVRGDNVGSLGYNENYTATETYIPVKENVEYTITRRNNVQGAIYDSNYTFIEGIIANDTTRSPLSKTMPSGAKYIRLSCLTEYIDDLKMYEGVYAVPSLYSDVHVPEMIEAYNIPINPTNYATLLPNVDTITETSIYKMYFSNGSTSIPSGLPFDRWITDESVMLITIGKDDPRVTGTYAGSQQMLIGKNFFFVRHYTSGWNTWNALYLRVRVGTGYGFTPNFSSLTEAIVFATKFKNSIVEVGNGTFNLYDEFRAYYGSDFFENETASSKPKGLHLTNGIRVICSSGSMITFNYPGSNVHVKQQFSPICFLSDCYDGFVLENANLECSNCRYVVHDDPGDTTAPYHNVYKNCKFYIDNTHNTDWTSTKAIGGGLGRGGHVRIEDCICKVNQTPNASSSIVSYHVDVYTQEGNNTVEMKGCYLDSGTFAAFYGGNKCDYIISNNSMFGDVIIAQNPGQSESQDTNINVYSWNNENRAS